MEPYVCEEIMEQYIKLCVANKTPIVALCENHLKFILNMLLTGYGIVESNIEKIENSKVCCKHYPFTCDEVCDFLDKAHSQCDPKYYEQCLCKGKCACDYSNVPERHYWEFSCEDEFMKHLDNCYDDCCSYSKVFVRYIIKYE